MASPASSASSSADLTCFHCHCVSAHFRPGWPLKEGGSAMLCDRCASAYEDGSFCEIFHVAASGWRECDACKKPIHCGCIMSAHSHIILDFGGIKCMECARKDRHIEVPNQHVRAFSISPPSQDPFDVDESQEVTSHGSPPPVGVENIVATPQVQSVSSELVEQSYLESSDGVESSIFSQITHEKPQEDAYGWIPVNHRRPCRIRTEAKVSPGSVHIPLYEKVLTATDADPKLGSLFLPENCGQVFFPELTEGDEALAKFEDRKGKVWEFSICVYWDGKQKVYVFERLGEYMAAEQWTPGDIATIYRIEPQGKLIVATKAFDGK